LPCSTFRLWFALAGQHGVAEELKAGMVAGAATAVLLRALTSCPSAGALAGLVSNPLDVIKTRIQTDDPIPGQGCGVRALCSMLTILPAGGRPSRRLPSPFTRARAGEVSIAALGCATLGLPGAAAVLTVCVAGASIDADAVASHLLVRAQLPAASQFLKFCRFCARRTTYETMKKLLTN
jgi:hypothetical protein